METYFVQQLCDVFAITIFSILLNKQLRLRKMNSSFKITDCKWRNQDSNPGLFDKDMKKMSHHPLSTDSISAPLQWALGPLWKK